MSHGTLVLSGKQVVLTRYQMIKKIHSVPSYKERSYKEQLVQMPKSKEWWLVEFEVQCAEAKRGKLVFHPKKGCFKS